ARAMAATVEAARFDERALPAARRHGGLDATERAAVWISLASVRDTGGLMTPSFDALRRATGLLAGHPVERARVYTKRALACMHSGAYALGLRNTSAGLRLVDDLDSTDAIGARASLRALRA